MDLSMGFQFYENGQFKRAIKFFEHVLELDASNSKAYEGRAIANYALLNIEQAVSDLKLAIKCNPKNHDSHFNLALIYSKKREFKAAKFHCKTAIENYGESIEYLEQFCLINFELKCFDQTKIIANRILELSFENRDAMELLASAHAETKEYLESLQYYEKVLKLEPDNAYANNNVGYVLSKCNKFQDSIRYFKKAIFLDPHFAYPYDNMGYSQYRMGQIKIGIDNIYKSLKIDPTNSYAYKNLGIIYYERDKMDKSIECFNKAIQLGFREDYGDEVDVFCQKNNISLS